MATACANKSICRMSIDQSISEYTAAAADGSGDGQPAMCVVPRRPTQRRISPHYCVATTLSEDVTSAAETVSREYSKTYDGA